MLKKPSIKENGYEIHKNVISSDVLELLNVEYEILIKADRALTKPDKFFYRIDSQVSKSFCWYAPIGSEALLVILKNTTSKVFNKPLLPTYSYARMYYKGARMEIHKDRGPCQFSITVNISTQGKPWPIFFIDKKGTTAEVFLAPGDACFYLGTELDHWRDEFEGEKMLQFFLHYVEDKEENKKYKFDGREELALPSIIPDLTQRI